MVERRLHGGPVRRAESRGFLLHPELVQVLQCDFRTVNVPRVPIVLRQHHVSLFAGSGIANDAVNRLPVLLPAGHLFDDERPAPVAGQFGDCPVAIGISHKTTLPF